MSKYRRAAKRDTSEPAIVDALNAAGFLVWRELPVDLLTYRYDRGFQVVEVKTPYGKKAPKARIDKRQEAQAEFIALTCCPVVMTPEEALLRLGAT